MTTNQLISILNRVKKHRGGQTEVVVRTTENEGEYCDISDCFSSNGRVVIFYKENNQLKAGETNE